MEELSEMTQELYKVSLEQFELVDGLGGNKDLLVKAIEYINQVHAVPLLRGNISWFNNTLRVLLELTCPNSILVKNSSPYKFLIDIENGVKRTRRNAIKE